MGGRNGPVGGNPAQIDVGGKALATVATALDAMPKAVRTADAAVAGADVDSSVAAAAGRLAAGLEAYVDGLHVQVKAAATLATNAAADLHTAGTPHR